MQARHMKSQDQPTRIGMQLSNMMLAWLHSLHGQLGVDPDSHSIGAIISTLRVVHHEIPYLPRHGRLNPGQSDDLQEPSGARGFLTGPLGAPAVPPEGKNIGNPKHVAAKGLHGGLVKD
eukprot:7762788-Pyramimonas_sp.AAC.1